MTCNSLRSILIAGTLAWAAFVCAQGSPSDSLALRQTLGDSIGQPYIDARNQALGLTPEQRDLLIAEMRAVSSPLPQKVAGIFVQGRAQHPDLAAEFDASIVQALAQPSRNRRGTLSYNIKVRRERHETDSFVLEAIIKLDLPISAKLDLFNPLNNPFPRNPLNIDPLLFMLESDTPAGFRGHTAFVIGQTARNYPDGRVAPALKAAYLAERTAHPMAMIDTADDIAVGLQYVGSTDALQAVLELIEFEQGFMAENGFTPWTDPDARQNAMTASREAGRIKGRATRDGRDFTPDEAAHLEQTAVLEKRLVARLLWETLTKARDKLQQMNPPPQP